MDPTSLQTLGDKGLYDFLVNCPKDFRENERIRKYQLKNGDYIHCVLWNYHFYITGTDIVKILIWRFQNAGRPIGAIKKFEEGIFSDLRNLKPGVDATLEGPRTEFLEFLYKNGCIRTQKKQKVFYWYSVPHDELFCDALERDLRRDTSMYAYNHFMQDPPRGPTTDIKHANAMPLNGHQIYGEPASVKLPVQEIHNAKPMSVNDIFNIKDALFGKGQTNCKPQIDYYGGEPVAMKRPFDPNPQANGASAYSMGNSPRRGLEQPGSSFIVGGQKMSFNGELPTSDAGFSAPSKSPLERKLNFDDFDLSQFEFLKERCMEQFGGKVDTCEKKLFEEPNQEEPRKSMDVVNEIRFVGSKDHN